MKCCLNLFICPRTFLSSWPTPIFTSQMRDRCLKMFKFKQNRRFSKKVSTSSLAVGRFAAKKGSLRWPRGRLVASLAKPVFFLVSLEWSMKYSYILFFSILDKQQTLYNCVSAKFTSWLWIFCYHCRESSHVHLAAATRDLADETEQSGSGKGGA